MEGLHQSRCFDNDNKIVTKRLKNQFLPQEQSDQQEQPKIEKKKEKKGWTIGQQLQQNQRAKTNLASLVGSTNKVFSYFMSTSDLRSHNQQVYNQGLHNIDSNTASQLLIAQRRFRESHALPHEYWNYAKAPKAYKMFKTIRATPSNSGTTNQLHYVVKNLNCLEPFQDLLKCVLNYEMQELCLVENKQFVQCIQEPVRELVLMSWGI